MAKFTVAASIPSGQTAQLGAAIAQALNDPATQSVEVLLRTNKYEVRTWAEVRDDSSNRTTASPNVDYSCG